MNKTDKIYIAGHRGMVGSAIQRKLEQEGFNNLIVRTSSALDLRNTEAVHQFFKETQPDHVILAAAKVGGIQANNQYKATFLYDNLMIQNNVIHQGFLHKVKKLLFLGSSCIYPKMAPQPIEESYLLTGLLEPTNEPYAIAKIAGIKMCEAYRFQYGCNFIAAMPTNLYGPNDNYDLETSHVLPAFIRKFHEAKQHAAPEVVIWGSGTPRREFLHVADLADACFFLMMHYNEKEFVNIGTGSDVTIKELAEIVKSIVGYKGNIVHDHGKPDGTPRKLLNVNKIHNLGWQHNLSLEEGIEKTYQSFLQEHNLLPI